MNNTPPRSREAYAWFDPMPTRWADNDVYGHVNNVAYYGFFDTAVNRFLIGEAGLDIHDGAVIGLVVETGCRYFAPLAYPEKLEAGVRVARLGKSSGRYEIGIFREGEDEPAAEGFFIHVYVDRQSRRPTPVPDAMRSALEGIHA